MRKPSQIRQPGLPASKHDDEPPIIQLTRRVKALEYEARGLALQHERWVDGVGQMMSRMNATATKLAKMAEELGRLEPPVSDGFEEFDF